MVSVEEVFTPGAPVREEALFSDRPREVELLTNALKERGAQIVVFGDSGVGKTSLVNFCLRTEGIKNVRVTCAADTTFSGLTATIFDRLGVQLPTASARQTSAGGELGGNLIVVKAGVQTTDATTYQYESAKPQPYDQLLAQAARQPLTLFIDDFEKVENQGCRTAVANLAKGFSDMTMDGPVSRVILVGVAESVGDLTHLDRSVLARLRQVHVPKMNREQLRQIIAVGSAKLGIRFEPGVVERIVEYSSGYPRFTHLLALESVRETLKRKGVLVRGADLAAGVKRGVEYLKQTYQDQVERVKAYRHGSKPYKWEIVKAFARTSDDVLRVSDLADVLTRAMEVQVRQSQFAPALRQLEDMRVATRTARGRWRLADPLLRSFVRMALESGELT